MMNNLIPLLILGFIILALYYFGRSFHVWVKFLCLCMVAALGWNWSYYLVEAFSEPLSSVTDTLVTTDAEESDLTLVYSGDRREFTDNENKSIGFGLTFVSDNWDYEANSVLTSSSGVVYSADNLKDLDHTFWQEGFSDSDGSADVVGEDTAATISIYPESAYEFNGGFSLAILNGKEIDYDDANYEEEYYANNRVKEVNVIVTYEDGSTDTLQRVGLLDEDKYYQWISCSLSKPVTCISIKIMSTYAGSVYNDTVLTDLEICDGLVEL